MTRESNPRRTFTILLFLAIAATAWLMMHEALGGVTQATHHDIAFDPGYQHSQRLQIAAARAAMDAVSIGSSGGDIDTYQADYRRQRMQIQADTEGLERWAAHASRHQGLLLEIRASLAGLLTALDQTTGSTAASGTIPRIPLLPALNRAEIALSNYSGSLAQPANLQRTHYLFASPVRLWWLMILLFVELAILAWLVFSDRNPSKTNALHR